MSAPEPEGVGPRLRAARAARGWSRQQLAIRSGVAYKTIENLERGERTHGRHKTIAALAAGLRMPIATLDPGQQAVGHAPAFFARHIDAAGERGLTRDELYGKAGRIAQAATLTAALDPLLASGSYEPVLHHVTANGRWIWAYRRVPTPARVRQPDINALT